jgi:putative permease
MANLVPRQWVDDTFRLARRCDEVLASFLRGQLLVMLCLGIIYAVGLTLLGLNFGLLIGVLSGLVSIVPFLGFIVGLVIALVVALFQFGLETQFWTILIIYGIIQALDGNVLVPLLFSEAVDLNPVFIIVAVLFFGGLWGFWGVFFAIPLASLVKALIKAWSSTHEELAEELGN